MSTRIGPAYLAGIIDGEGPVYVRKNSPHVSVGNTSKDLIDALAELGGYVLVRKPGRSIGKKQGWDWVISGERAAIVLRACLPFLIIKADKAREALEAQKKIVGSNSKHFAAKATAEMHAIGWAA